MADLSYTVDVKGAGELQTLASGITAVTKALNSSGDAAKKLAEFKRALGDMGGATSGLQTLERELEKLNRTFKAAIRGMSSGMKTEMDAVKAAIQTSGLGIQTELAKAMKAPKVNLQNAIPKQQDIAQVKALSSSFQKLTIDGNDVHSAMRGLASGFNLLWLTWGNLLPLFAGAAISNGFMKTAKEGLKVTQTLGTIAYLGENTATEMQALTGELVRMGNEGIYGPVAIAEAMQTLSLAGLKANEILAVTGTVMGFSVAGATDIKTAADVLVSVTTAFGTGAGGFSRSADIIMRAAADSKASVESFGAAMKTASVVGEQYGAKQEDVALLIQYLANLGIQGTAAGTAVRNMYADISGRSGPARKAMKELGLDFRDANGHVVGLKEQTDQLLTVLSKYDGKSQANIIQAIYGERGAKAAIEMLVKAKTYILENGKLTSQLEIDQRKLENAYGDAAITAVKMGTTTENAFKAAGATLETTLFGAFTAMEPQLYAVATALRQAFGSKDLLDTLSTLVGFIADIAKYVAENIQTIVSAGLAYGAYKLAVVGVTLAYGLYQNVLATVNAVKAINLARTAAQTVGELELGAALGVRSAAEIASAKATATSAAASAGKLTVVGSLAKAIPFVGTAITLAGLAWMGYDMWSSRAGKGMADLSGQKADDMIAALEKENTHLAAVNVEREKGLGLLEAEARVKANNAKADISMGGMTKLSALQSEIDVLQSSRDKAQASYGSNTPGETPHDIQVMDLQLARKRVEMRKAGEEERVKQVALARVEEERSDHAIHVSVLNQRDRDKEFADQKKLMGEYAKLYGTGKQTWEQATAGSGHTRTSREGYYDDKALQNLDKQLTEKLSIIKSRYDEEKAIQDNAYKNLLIGQAEYSAASAFTVAKYEQDSINAIKDGAAISIAEYAKTYATISESRDKVLGGKKPDVEQGKQLTAQLEKLQNDQVTRTEKTTGEIEKIQNESNRRILTSTQDLQGEVMKLIKSDKDYWAKNASESKKAKALDEIADKYRYINTSIFSTATAEKAAAEAKASTIAGHETQLDLMRKELDLRIENADALEQTISLQLLLDSYGEGANMEVIRQLQARLAVMRDGIDKMKDQIGKSTENALKDGAEKGALAFKKEMDAKAEMMTNGITDALITSIEDGAAAGAKKLRKFLTDELLRKPFTMVVQAMLQPIVGNIMSAVVGGGATGGGGLLGMALQGTSLYSGLTSGTGVLGSIGGWLGMGGAGGAGAAGLGGSVGALGTGISADAYAGIAASGGSSGIMSGLSSALGAIPGWGWALAAVAGIASLLSKPKTYHTGGAGSYSDTLGVTLGPEVRKQGITSGVADKNFTDETNLASATISKSIVGLLNSTAATFGKDAGYFAATAFADDKSKDGAWGSLLIKQLDTTIVDWADTQTSKWAPKEFADGEKGQAEYLKALAVSTRDALKSMGLPEWADKIAKSMPDSGTMDDLTAVMAKIQAYPSELLAAYGTSRDDLVSKFVEGLTTGDAMAAGTNVANLLVDSIQNSLYSQAAGKIFDIVNLGIVTPMLDAMMTGASVSEALSKISIDKIIENAKAQAAVLADLYSNPEFLSVLDSIRTNVGSALGQAGTVLQRIPYVIQTTADAVDKSAESAVKAAEDAQKAWQDITDSLLGDKLKLSIELLRALGNEEEALKIERKEAIKGMDDYQVGLYDANQGTRALIDSLTKMHEISKTLAEELPGVISKFLTPEQNTANSYSSIAGDLIKAGLSGMGTADLAKALTGASKNEIASAAAAIYNMTDVTDEMRLALIRAAGGLADLKDAAVDVRKSETDAAMTALEKAVSARKALLQESITAIRSVFDAVRDNAKALYGEVDSTTQDMARAGRAFIDNALSNAKLTGYLPDADALKTAIADARAGINGTQYATKADADWSRLSLAGDLSQLQVISGNQLSEAEKQLKALDDLLANSHAQVDALRGIDASVIGVEAAVVALAAAIGREKAGGGSGGGARNSTKPADTATVLQGMSGAQIDLASGIGYQSKTGLPYMLGDIRTVAADLVNGGNGKAVYDAIKSEGYTLAQANSILGMGPGEAEKWAQAMGLPIYHNGTNYVPQTGLALLQQGERVTSAAANRAGTDNARLEALVEALTVAVLDGNVLQRRTANAVNGNPEMPMLVAIG